MATTTPNERLPPMRAQDMLLDLVRLPHVLQRLTDQRLEWQPLAAALQRVNPDGSDAPTGKQLQQELGLSASRYRRWLDALYASYLHLLETDADALACQSVMYQLILTGQRASQSLRCRLPVAPRVGEQLQLDFLRAVTGDAVFYVDSITHDFSDGRYEVLVYLKAGYFNSYLHELRQRVRFDRVMSLHALHKTPEYLLEDLLRERYPPPDESDEAFAMLEQAEARYGSRSLFGGRRIRRKPVK